MGDTICGIDASKIPRTEVSEDARYIAKRIVGTLWTIFVLLPIVFGVLYAGLTEIK
jgi:hypothetical protein